MWCVCIHNCLGDYYRLRKELEPAFWEYLKVDTLYSQDKEESAKALYYLAELFDKVKNDKVRAEECLTRLKGAPYSGTLYQLYQREEPSFARIRTSKSRMRVPARRRAICSCIAGASSGWTRSSKRVPTSSCGW